MHSRPSGRSDGGGMATNSELYEFQQTAQVDNSLLIDRYVLEETIGRGGMASVYRATDSMLGRQVAIKLLHRSISRDSVFVEQFLEMERRIARLFHPNL